jgi:hypothetical protein
MIRDTATELVARPPIYGIVALELSTRPDTE